MKSTAEAKEIKAGGTDVVSLEEKENAMRGSERGRGCRTDHHP
jgi:hypothetical protein